MPPSLLVMMEPRVANTRMPAYSRYFASMASISSSTRSVSSGSQMMRMPVARMDTIR